MTLKDILEQAKNMDIIAARDRDSFDTPWRRVMLQKLSRNAPEGSRNVNDIFGRFRFRLSRSCFLHS
jgi:hypothetical protein